MTEVSRNKSFPANSTEEGSPSTQRGALAISEIVPPDTGRLAEYFRWFQRFKAEILTADDWMDIRGKPFLKKSGYRKLEFAGGVSDEIVEQERVPSTGQDPVQGFYWRVVTRAYHNVSGRSSVGVAIASSSERKTWSHQEHDVYALAATRSKNRAISDLLAGGSVSAEELLPNEHVEESATQQASTQSEPSPPIESHPTSDPWIPTVPVFKDPITRQGLRQIPLTEGLRTFGMVNATETEVSLIPERPIPPAGGAIQSFLLHRVLDAIKAKHSGVDYFVKVDENGLLQGIFIKGLLEESQIKELAGAAKWAFQRTLETETAMVENPEEKKG